MKEQWSMSRIGGKKAQSNGSRFESDVLIAAARREYKILDIPDGAKTFGRGKIIRMKSPFDFVAAKIFSQFRERFLFFDAKTTEKKKFAAASINISQVENLSHFSLFKTAQTGYVVNFDAQGTVSFFTAEQLSRAFVHRTSLAPDDGLILGNRFTMNFDKVFECEWEYQ